MRISDWSSDVCSSDLARAAGDEQWHHAANERERGHDDRAKPQLHRLQRGRQRCFALRFPLDRELDDQDRVLGGKTDDGDEADVEINVRRSEEHTSELPSLMRISYAVFCLKKKTREEEQKLDTNQ